MIPALDLPACAATAWQATPDMALRALIAAGLTALAGWAGARRRFPGQRAFVALTLVMAAWTACSLIEHAAVAADCKGTVALLSWTVIMAQPPLYALFLYQYLHSEMHGGVWRTRWLLALPSAVLVALALANGWHGLFYGHGTRLSEPMFGLPRLRYDYEPLFYAAVTLGYAWLLAATVMVVRAWRDAQGLQRRQWTVFLLMMAVPLGANFAYIAFGVRLMGVDPTSTAFAFTLAGFAWLIRRNRLFAAVPLARRLLFEELPDPVLVLDAEGRIAEVNHAAQRLVPPPLLDQPLAQWPRFGPALARHVGAADTVIELAGPAAWFEVQHRVLGTPAQPLGALILMHDVSARHQAHAETVRTLAARELELDKATALQALLREQAMHDPLTGLLNRRALLERYGHETREAGVRLALVVLDLDHFKRINDTHGHPAGDAVLRDFAAALRSGLRAGDALFRLGGEEFALLLPGASAAQAAARVEGLRTIVGRWHLGQLGEAVTFSAGVAVGGEGPLESLLAAADEALYLAKRNGRNRTEVSTREAQTQ
ncbi:MAG: diguanylate cyclase [Rubrivivax sp.]|nr:diguanylate cyclase [Rubrivivax sp.]